MLNNMFLLEQSSGDLLLSWIFEAYCSLTHFIVSLIALTNSISVKRELLNFQ